MNRAGIAAVAAGFFALVQLAHARDVEVDAYLDCRVVARAHERSGADGGLGKTR